MDVEVADKILQNSLYFRRAMDCIFFRPLLNITLVSTILVRLTPLFMIHTLWTRYLSTQCGSCDASKETSRDSVFERLRLEVAHRSLSRVYPFTML